MTTEQTKRIQSAIADCDRYINRVEGKIAEITSRYGEQPADVQKRLDWYKEHKINLFAMLTC